MKIAKKITLRCTKFTPFLIVLAALCSIASAQIAGDNAVWTSPTAVGGSNSFIDASVLGGADICAKLYTALGNLSSATNYPAGAAVIDARGITSGSAMTCASGTTPWYNGTTLISNPAIILLPPGTITVNTTWLMPSRTRIIGEGSGSNGTSVTTLQAASTLTGTIIQMGATTSTQGYTCPGSICFGIGVEDLRLDGNASSVTVNGIVNDASQELTYVNRVDLYNIKGIGLLVGNTTGGIASTVTGNSKAQNSGPYSNIKFENTTSTNVATSTICVQILGAPTRGVHGLTCTSTTGADAAVVLDASNNSIEDVSITGFVDGIVLGANSDGDGTPISEDSDVLLNISGAPGTNLIHICKPGETGTTNCSSNTSGGQNVADLSILGVYDTASTTNTILDDETTTTLTAASSGDPHVGAYILGRQVTVGSVTAWSRFSTSAHIPTWFVGNGTISGTCSTKGALYSNIGSTATTLATTVYACTGSWTGL